MNASVGISQNIRLIIGDSCVALEHSIKRRSCGEKSEAFHQLSERRVQCVCDSLNCEQRRILNAAFDAAEKGAVNIGLRGNEFLCHTLLEPGVFDAPAKLLRDVMPHSPDVLALGAVCGL